MKAYSDRKFTIIGLGFLMEYIFPCFRKSLGEKTSAQINAVTADAGDLEGKKQRLGIHVLLNDNSKALREMEPDIIFFAPPPTVARQLAEGCLAPYYRELREKRKPIPQLVAFPPSPAGAYYMEQLGEDLQVVNIIPNMISRVGTEDVSVEAHHLLTYPKKDNWSEKEKRALFDFLSPMGRSLLVSPSLILSVLSAEIGAHPLTELVDVAAQNFSARSIPCTYQQTASVMRALHQRDKGYRAPGSNRCGADDVPHAGAAALLGAAVKAWYDALYSFLIGKGFPEENSKRLLDPLFDLYLHEAQVEDRKTIVDKARKDATKGGMLELCMETYYSVSEPLWRNYFTAEKPDETLLAECSRVIDETAHAVVERGKGLADSQTNNFTPRQHAVMFAFLAKNVLDIFGEEEGDALLWEAVEKYGMQRGGRMAQRCEAHGRPLDMVGYQAFTEWRYNGDFEKAPLFDEPYSAYRVLNCPWFAAWKSAGLGKYGSYYCRVVDVSLLKGFNSELTLEMPSYHSEGGGDYCEFHWKDFVPDKGYAARKSDIEKEIGDSCLKDFVYHTAHVYSTIAGCARRKDAMKGERAALQARREFAEMCSYQELLKVLALTKQNFDKER
jgi:hypothetical protein